jgi:hypothetical protein
MNQQINPIIDKSLIDVFVALFSLFTWKSMLPIASSGLLMDLLTDLIKVYLRYTASFSSEENESPPQISTLLPMLYPVLIA